MDINFKLRIDAKPGLFLKSPARITHTMEKVEKVKPPASDQQKREAVAKRLGLHPSTIILVEDES